MKKELLEVKLEKIDKEILKILFIFHWKIYNLKILIQNIYYLLLIMFIKNFMKINGFYMKKIVIISMNLAKLFMKNCVN